MPGPQLGQLMNPIPLEQPRFNQNPVSAPIAIPQQPVAPPQGMDALAQGWNSFFENMANDPTISQGLLAAGASMLAPRARGQSQASKVAEGAVVGTERTRQLRKDDAQETRRDKLVSLQERNTVVGEKSQEQGSRREDTRLGMQQQLQTPKLEILGQQIAAMKAENSPERQRLLLRQLQNDVSLSDFAADPANLALQRATLQQGLAMGGVQLRQGLAGVAQTEEATRGAAADRAAMEATPGLRLTGQERIMSSYQQAFKQQFPQATDDEAWMASFKAINPDKDTPVSVFSDTYKYGMTALANNPLMPPEERAAAEQRVMQASKQMANFASQSGGGRPLFTDVPDLLGGPPIDPGAAGMNTGGNLNLSTMGPKQQAKWARWVKNYPGSTQADVQDFIDQYPENSL